MKSSTFSTLAMTGVASLVVIPLALAQTAMTHGRMYNTSDLPYSDVIRTDYETSVPISVLTAEGVLEGNPDGTFRPDALLNRAEFVKIVIGMMNLGLVDGRGSGSAISLRCFPDVATNTWYAPYVCRAKDLGIVRGDARTDVSQSQWRFNPARHINYAEAVKVLAEAFDAPVVPRTGDEWYVPYVSYASQRDLGISGLVAGDSITRGEMARLAANFLAYQDDELDILQDAQEGRFSSSSSSMTTSSSSRSSSSSSSTSSVFGSGSLDPRTDTTVSPQYALLGETTPIIASATFFSNDEPINVEELSLNLASANANLRSVLFYDSNRRFLGRGYLDSSISGNTRYTADLPSGYVLPRRENVSIYVRGDLRTFLEGGTANTQIQPTSFTVMGNGQWTASDYNLSSSNITTANLLTSRAMITNVTNAGQANAPLVSGQNVRIAQFRFEGRRTDTSSDLTLTSIQFTVSKSSNVSLSNVRLGIAGFSDRMNCSYSDPVITCTGLTSPFGILTSGSQTIELYADVALSSFNNGFLSVTISDPGTSTTAGDIVWSDTSNTYNWVPSIPSGVASTRYSL